MPIKKNNELKKFKNFLKKINIKKGDKILITSSMLPVLLNFKNKKSILTPNIILDLIIDKIGRNGTLLIPTFNWDFCKKKTFDYYKTRSQAGSLGDLALKKKKFLRSQNPIYSFAIYGRDKDKLCNMKHKNCFAKNSPFGYLIKNSAKNLFIGIDFRGGFTPVHVAEQDARVNYRYIKKFSANYIDKNKKKSKKSYFMFVRKLNIKVKMTGIKKKFNNILSQNNCYQRYLYKNVKFSILNLKKVHYLMVKDIKNKIGNIYPRKKLIKDK